MAFCICKFIKPYSENVSIKKNKVYRKKTNVKNSLFWCFFKIMNPDIAYEMQEKDKNDFRMKFIEEAKIKKAILKENKISYTKLEENFLKDTNVLELRALCLLYNINVIIVKKKIYQSIIYSDDNILRFIELVDGNYKIIDAIEDLKNNFLEVTNIEKPLKSMSAYKLCDLKKICDVLKISHSIEKKADLYSKIELII